MRPLRAAVLALCLPRLAGAAIVTETYTDRAAFDARLGGMVRVVTFDDVDTGIADPAAFAADRYAASEGIVITGESGQYASRDFGFPSDYPTSSAPNAYAPGPIEHVFGGGNVTVVTFVANGGEAGVAGFGLVFVDPDLPQVSRLRVFDADQLLEEAVVPDDDKGLVFRGIVAVDGATSMPAPVISRAEIVSGTGWPGGSVNDGVPLDDFAFGVPVAGGGTSTTTTIAGSTTTSTNLPPLACAAEPLPGCRTPVESGGATLLVYDPPRARHGGVRWRWGRGSATTKLDFGYPPGGTGLAFCVYDARGLVFEIDVPGGGTCRRRPCWRETRTGFAYRDRARRAAGLSVLALVGGGDGDAHVALLAAGPAVAPPALPLALPVTTQLVRQDGARCWASRMSTSRKSTPTRFRARSD